MFTTITAEQAAVSAALLVVSKKAATTVVVSKNAATDVVTIAEVSER